MEKRLILAMLLIFITMMVWYSVMTPPKSKFTDRMATDPDSTRSDSKNLQSNLQSRGREVKRNSSEDSLLFYADADMSDLGDTTAAIFQDFDFRSPGESISVKTDFYQAQIQTLGASLESWVLREFRGYVDGERVLELPLISSPDPRKNECNLSFRMNVDERDIDFSQVVFTPDKKKIDLTQGAESDTLTLTAERGLQRITVKYLFSNGQYSFGLDIDAQNIDLIDKKIEFQWDSGLNLTEKETKIDVQNLAALVDNAGDIEDFDQKDATKAGGELTIEGAYRWLALKTTYFAFIVSPLNTNLEQAVFISSEETPNRISARWRLPAETLGHNREDFEIYLGPQSYDVLQKYHRNWEHVVDFGWKWIEPLSRMMLLVFTLLHDFIPNYGLVIIAFSILIKLIFYPLMQKQLKSMKAMQELQPEMEKLKAKHKDNPQKLNQDVIKLYQKHKVNPVGGCLPLVVQMPIFLALFNVLRTTIHLRDTRFLWISDLSQSPEFSLLGCLLPLVMGASMFATQKMSSTSAATQQQKMMLYLMPVIFTVFSFQWSSGLILYWFVSNIATILQQMMINRYRKEEKKDPVVS